MQCRLEYFKCGYCHAFRAICTIGHNLRQGGNALGDTISYIIIEHRSSKGQCLPDDEFRHHND